MWRGNPTSRSSRKCRPFGRIALLAMSVNGSAIGRVFAVESRIALVARGIAASLSKSAKVGDHGSSTGAENRFSVSGVVAIEPGVTFVARGVAARISFLAEVGEGAKRRVRRAKGLVRVGVVRIRPEIVVVTAHAHGHAESLSGQMHVLNLGVAVPAVASSAVLVTPLV